MTLKDYQKQAMTTCMESSNNVAYMFMNLVGEVGELAEKMSEHAGKPAKHDLKILANVCAKFGQEAKQLRKNPDTMEAFELRNAYERVRYTDEASKDEIKKECGDIFWQTFGVVSALGWDAEDIAQQNLEKLKSRRERNVIDGNGDNR